jgi:hypothetical protein
MPYPAATTKLYLGSKVQVDGDAFNFNGASVDFSSSTINYGSNGIDSKVSSLLTDVAAIHSTISADEATVQTIKDTIAGINTMIASDEKGAAALTASVGALRSDVSTVQSKVDSNFSNTILFSNSNYDLGKRVEYVDSSKTQLINELRSTVQNNSISTKAYVDNVKTDLDSEIAAIKTSLTADESTIATVSSGITAINTLLSTQDKISLQNPTSDDISNCIDGNNNFIQIVLLQDATSVYSDVLKNADIFDSNNVSTKYIGWTVSGPNVPDNCLIRSYRYDTTYTGYHAIYADTTKIIPYSGDNTTYTLTNLKVESFIALQNSVSDIKKKTDVITYNNGELLLNADVRGGHLIQSTYMNTAQLGAFQSDHINVECDLLMYQATVKNVKNPIDAKDVANKDYVDSTVATLQAKVDQLSGALDSLYMYFFKTTAANVAGVDGSEPRPYVPNEPLYHPGKT